MLSNQHETESNRKEEAKNKRYQEQYYTKRTAQNSFHVQKRIDE